MLWLSNMHEFVWKKLFLPDQAKTDRHDLKKKKVGESYEIVFIGRKLSNIGNLIIYKSFLNGYYVYIIFLMV